MNPLRPYRILMIEDSEIDRLLLVELLGEVKEFPHQVDEAETLAEGILKAKASQADVILLDLSLPDSTGLDTFALLHRQASTIPTLVLTALDDQALGTRAVQLGAQDYLVKGQLEARSFGRMLRYAIERQEVYGELVRSRQQLRELAIRLQAVREIERTCLAREIHDQLGQALTALKMDLRHISRKMEPPLSPESRDDIMQTLVAAGELADRTISKVQRIALELRPSVLDNLGLEEAIRDEARRFQARTAIEVSVHAPFPISALRADVSTGCFRVYQELLTNVFRHSQARHVRVELLKNDPFLELVVHDDGKGFSHEILEKSTSLGLLGMMERSVSLGGDIKFDSGPEIGTRAVLKVPLQFA